MDLKWVDLPWSAIAIFINCVIANIELHKFNSKNIANNIKKDRAKALAPIYSYASKFCSNLSANLLPEQIDLELFYYAEFILQDEEIQIIKNTRTLLVCGYNSQGEFLQLLENGTAMEMKKEINNIKNKETIEFIKMELKKLM